MRPELTEGEFFLVDVAHIQHAVGGGQRVFLCSERRRLGLFCCDGRRRRRKGRSGALSLPHGHGAAIPLD